MTTRVIFQCEIEVPSEPNVYRHDAIVDIRINRASHHFKWATQELCGLLAGDVISEKITVTRASEE